MRRIRSCVLACAVLLLLPLAAASPAAAQPGGGWGGDQGSPFSGSWWSGHDQVTPPWLRPTPTWPTPTWPTPTPWPTPPWAAHAPGPWASNFTFTGTTGATALVHPGYLSGTAAQITTTDPVPGDLSDYTWGAVDVAIPGNLTFGQIRWLSTMYKFTLGSCWGGSPRFELWIPDAASSSGHVKVFLYIGPPPSYVGCASGTWVDTGNLVTPGSYVDDSQLPGGSYADTWAHALQLYGNDPISAVYVDADGGWDGNQVIEFDDTQVNSTLVTYETHW